MQSFDNSEMPGHPLTREGFLAWAEDQVKKHPELDGGPNTIERELAEVLIQDQWELLSDTETRIIREWVSDVLMLGQRGCAGMTREELLDLIDQWIIRMADNEVTTVEEIVGGE